MVRMWVSMKKWNLTWILTWVFRMPLRCSLAIELLGLSHDGSSHSSIPWLWNEGYVNDHDSNRLCSFLTKLSLIPEPKVSFQEQEQGFFLFCSVKVAHVLINIIIFKMLRHFLIVMSSTLSAHSCTQEGPLLLVMGSVSYGTSVFIAGINSW